MLILRKVQGVLLAYCPVRVIKTVSKADMLILVVKLSWNCLFACLLAYGCWYPYDEVWNHVINFTYHASLMISPALASLASLLWHACNISNLWAVSVSWLSVCLSLTKLPQKCTFHIFHSASMVSHFSCTNLKPKRAIFHFWPMVYCFEMLC